MEIEVVVGQVLFVNESVESNIKGFTLEDRLAFTEAVTMNLHSRQLSSFLLIRHLAVVGKSIAVEIEQTVVPEDQAIPRQFDLTISEQLFVWDEAVNEGFFPLVEQSVILEQTVEVDVAIGIYDIILVSQTLDLEITRNLVIEQTFSPIEGATGYLPSKYWASYEIEVVAS